MRQDERAPFHRALQRARVAAYAPGEFVGQESFMTAGEIRLLAARAGIGPGVSVLDLCCGTAGPGTLLTRELGCDYLGVDASASALVLARERAGEAPCRFSLAHVPPLPPGSFDVVLLLETLLAFPDKDTLVGAIATALRPGGASPSPWRRARRSRRPSGRRCPTPTPSGWGARGARGIACAGRAHHHVARGPQPHAPCAGCRAGGRVRRGRRGDLRADRPPGPGGAARRPSAVGGVAGRGTGPQARTHRRLSTSAR